MTRIRQHCVATLCDDDDAWRLQFELADDRAVTLTYWKNGDLPSVSIWQGSIQWDSNDYAQNATPEEFEDWAKVALGAMSPDCERRWLCQICKERDGGGPMLHDEIWAAIKVFPDPGYSDRMCFECMQKRATEIIGRKLTVQDLTDCPYNSMFSEPGAAS
jgi:hypothetical protein